MPEPVSFITAMLVGFLGSTHCMAMCGGIVTALSFAGTHAHRPVSANLPYIISYNLGRVATYCLAGFIMTFLFASVYTQGLSEFVNIQLVSAIFMILLGLYISRWWLILARLEVVAKIIWRHLEPLSRRWIPVRTLPQAFLVGVIWGWLPCGMVYSALIYAVASADALQGTLIMLGFGIGTLPALLLMGTGAAVLQRILHNTYFRTAGGLMIILLGIYMMNSALGGGHSHH